MSEQPEALRLADALEISSNHGIRREAAAELRRLRAEVEEQCRLNGMGSEREAKLMAENEALTVERDLNVRQCDVYLADVRRLVAENEALRADAERYRYLRNRNPPDVLDATGSAAGVWIDCEDESETLILLTGDDADAAIDAAKERT